MFLKEGSIIKVKSKEKISKVAKKCKFNNSYFVKDGVLITKDMILFNSIAIEKDCAVTDNTPVIYKGWRWYAWMLDLPVDKNFEIE